MVVTGRTTSYDVLVTGDAFQPDFVGVNYPWQPDAFLARLNASGSDLVYSAFFRGTGAENFSVACAGAGVDGTGAMYFSGDTFSTNLSTTTGAFDTTFNGSSPSGGWSYGDVFVAKLTGTVQYCGEGVPGCLGPHGLGVKSCPQLGNARFGFECTNAPPHAIGLVIVSDTWNLVGTDLFGIGIPMHVGFTGSEVLTFDLVSEATGLGSVAIPIPSIAALAGKRYAAQALWYWPSGPCTLSPVTPLSASQGLMLTIVP